MNLVLFSKFSTSIMNIIQNLITIGLKWIWTRLDIFTCSLEKLEFVQFVMGMNSKKYDKYTITNMLKNIPYVP